MLFPLLLASLAHAEDPRCVFEHHSTVVRWTKRPHRTDTQLFKATADHACTSLSVLGLPFSRLQGVRARVVRPDGPALVFGKERLVPAAEGWRLALPEAGKGDVVELVVQRHIEGETTLWDPAEASTASLVVRGKAALWSAGASTALWWSGRAEQPAQTRVLTEGPSGVVLVSTALPPPPQGPARRKEVPKAPSGTSLVLVPFPGSFLPGEPPAGRTVHASFWNHAPPSGWHAGPGSVGAACAVGPQATGELSATLSLPVVAPSSLPVQAACAWVEDRLAVAGELETGEAAWRIEGPGLQVWSEPAPEQGEPGPSSLRRVGAFDSTVYEGDASTKRLVWVLSALEGAPVLPDRETAMARVAYAALKASLPEPGLPLSYKNRRPDLAFVASLVRRVQRQVRTDALPGRGPLRPRRLVRLQRSGWSTPWESALLLSRLLRQARLAATPIPVRPRSSGPVPPEVPVGYTQAVIFVEDAEQGKQTAWGPGYFLSPTCRVCAPGELPPGLWGSQVLTPGQQNLPLGPEPEIRVEQQGTALSLSLSPPAALALRIRLLGVSPSERAAALPELLGLPALALQSQEGLQSPGSEVALVLGGFQTGSLVWSAAGPIGVPQGTPGPARVTAMRVATEQAERALVVQEGQLRWRGRLEKHPSGMNLVEELTRGPEPVSPDAARRFHNSVEAALHNLLATPRSPSGDSTPSIERDNLRPEVP